jgi:ribonuclease-3
VTDDGDRAIVLERLERALGHRFERREWLELALRHSSYAHERSRADASEVESNERLEFLGDAVLGVVVAHALFSANPDWREGDLSRTLHALVEKRSLEKLARSLELGPVLLLGKTERQSGGHDKPTILADTLEAILGAIYLDGGLPAAQAFVERLFGDALSPKAPVGRDPKTELQERTMIVHGDVPIYRVIGDSEVEGDPERFTVEAVLLGKVLAEARGRTKRDAERAAAKRALDSGCADLAAEV